MTSEGYFLYQRILKLWVSETSNNQLFIHFSFDLVISEGYFQHHDDGSENYRSVRCLIHKEVTDKNNNVSFESLDIHYY